MNDIKAIKRAELVKLLNDGYTINEISNMFSVSEATIYNYIRRFKITKIYR